MQGKFLKPLRHLLQPLVSPLFCSPAPFPKREVGMVEAREYAAPEAALFILTSQLHEHALKCPWIFSSAAIRGALHQLDVVQTVMIRNLVYHVS